MDKKDIVRVLASVTTLEATVVGEILLPQIDVSGSSYHFRLLELLNNPKLGMSLTGQIEETLVLEGAMVVPSRGEVIPIAKRLHVRTEQIIDVFEYDSSREKTPLQYDRMRYRGAENLTIITTGGRSIEGVSLGGAGLLASAAAKRFVPITNATLQDLHNAESRMQTPFIIVNRAAIVAFSASPEK